jgi:hypothetical protein
MPGSSSTKQSPKSSQAAISPTAGSAVPKLPSHGVPVAGPSPAACRMVLIVPVPLGAISQVHTIATTTVTMTWGRK